MVIHASWNCFLKRIPYLFSARCLHFIKTYIYALDWIQPIPFMAASTEILYSYQSGCILGLDGTELSDNILVYAMRTDMSDALHTIYVTLSVLFLSMEQQFVAKGFMQFLIVSGL